MGSATAIVVTIENPNGDTHILKIAPACDPHHPSVKLSGIRTPEAWRSEAPHPRLPRAGRRTSHRLAGPRRAGAAAGPPPGPAARPHAEIDVRQSATASPYCRPDTPIPPVPIR